MYTIGIDLGGTNIAVGLCDESLKMIDKESVKTHAQRPAEEIVSDMAEVSRLLIERNGLTLDDIEYVGVLVPGTVNKEDGSVDCTPNLPFSGLALSEEFRKHLPIERIMLENDANAAALAEYLVGQGKGAKSLIMVTIGTGIGGGIILNGKIFTGGINSHGAEVGHTVIVANGRRCGCGRRGCWEAYASASALKALTRDTINDLEKLGVKTTMADWPKVSARTAFSCAREGDAEAAKLVNLYTYYLSLGITNLINIFQPEILLIGGGVCGEGDNLILPLTEIVNREQYTRNHEVKTKIMTAKLGNDAGIIGAAALGRQI